MADPSRETVTRLLDQMEDGGRLPVDQLFDRVYDELRVLARRQRRRWRGDHTLDTTALIHEAYLKLVDGSRVGAGSRAHFFALASKAMRHVLCNYAREKAALKRGGGMERVTLEDEGLAAASEPLDSGSAALAALDDALDRLAELEPRQARVVECRFFGGMSVEETAAALGVSPRTVKRDWALSQAWLHREIEG